VIEDFERCYRALRSRDTRFDGWVFAAVTSTGIYCRPSCPARTPKPENVRFYPTAATAQHAGFRACMRCRPDAAPGSPEWNTRADAVARAMKLIADGVVDREGVAGLARRIGYSERQLHRQLVAELGTGAIALARAQRAQTARVLIETTDVPMAEIAFAAGFASIRQFNATIHEVFAMTPTRLRRSARPGGPRAAGTIGLRLAHRTPFDGGPLLAFLGARAVPGVEAFADGVYRRSLRLPHGEAVVELTPREGHVWATFHLGDLRDLTAAVTRCRRLLDLDADPVAVDEALGTDPLLAPLVRRAPGRRLPGAVDGAELAVRAVVGQQVSVTGARTVAGRLVAALGDPLVHPRPPVTHLFPAPGPLAAADPTTFPMPAARVEAVRALAAAVAGGRLAIDPGSDRAELEPALLALPGIGPWTIGYVAMRALGDPDAFLPTDLGVRRALERLGEPGTPAAATRLAERWRPWRAYAMTHLWSLPLGPEESGRGPTEPTQPDEKEAA
jgi:AraC family transcriptional regulator of adaptative response / DNA-3-methyladenine glycosylase II